MKSESKVGKTSYRAVQKNLDIVPAAYHCQFQRGLVEVCTLLSAVQFIRD